MQLRTVAQICGTLIIVGSTVAGSPTLTLSQAARPGLQACLDRNNDESTNVDKRVLACSQVIGDPTILAADRAEAYLRRALAYGQKAELLNNDDFLDHAIADLTEGIRLDPENTAAQHYVLKMRGSLYFHRGYYDQALADYTDLLRLEPNSVSIYSYRGIVFAAEGDPDRAIADFTEAIRINPNAAVIYNNRALAYLQTGKPAEALADADRAVALEPNDAASYSARIVINRAAERKAEVVNDLRKALSLDPSNEAIRSELQLAEATQVAMNVEAATSFVQGSISVQSIFEHHDLIGTFAEDCTKEPSDSNQYIVHRVIDANHIERDQMKSRVVRSYAAIVDNADEVTSSDMGMNILIIESANAQMKDWRMRLVTRIEGNRVRLMESGPLSGPYAGQKNIVAGKTTNGGSETHWLKKCQ